MNKVFSMCAAPNRKIINPREVAIGVGRDLRRARLDLRWTRQKAAARVPGMAVNTLDNNETGARMCNLVTLVRLCRSMALLAPDVLALTMQRMGIDLDMIPLHVDLREVSIDRYPPRRVRQWAARMLYRGEHQHGVVRVRLTTIEKIARTTHTSEQFLVDYLTERPPYSVRGSRAICTRTEPGCDPLSPTFGMTRNVFARALGVELRALRVKSEWTSNRLSYNFQHQYPHLSGIGTNAAPRCVA